MEFALHSQYTHGRHSTNARSTHNRLGSVLDFVAGRADDDDDYDDDDALRC